MTGIIFGPFVGNQGSGAGYAPGYKARGTTSSTLFHGLGAGLAPQPFSAGKENNTGHGAGFAPKAKGFGTPETISALGAGYAPVFEASGFDSDITISINFGYGAAPRPHGAGSGQVLNPGFGAGYVKQPWGRAYAEGRGAAPFGVGIAPVFRSFGLRGLIYQGIVTVQESPGWTLLEETSAPNTMYLYDHFDFSTEDLRIIIGMVFGDTFSMHDALSGRRHAHMTIGDSMLLTDLFVFINRMDLSETLTLTDSMSMVLGKMMILADVLTATDQLTSLRQALMTIATAIYLSDQLATGSILAIDDTITLTAQNSLYVHSIVNLLDQMSLTEQFAMRLNAIMYIKDTVTITDTATLMRAMQMGLADEIFLGGQFRFMGDDYTVYAVNTVNSAVSEYTGWQFNSMCVIDGVAYGADGAAVSALEGDSDNGNPIIGEVYTGLSTLGTSVYKRVPKAYVGFRSNGDMMMKVVSTFRGGKREDWYNLDPIPLDSFETARCDIGLGLQAVYFGFKITNVEGQYFETDFVEVWRLAIGRRKL